MNGLTNLKRNKIMKKLLILIMLIICTSAFSTNVDTPHLVTSSEYSDCDDEDDDHDDEGEDVDDDDDDDDDDDHPAFPINGYACLLLIAGCIYIFKSTSNKKE